VTTAVEMACRVLWPWIPPADAKTEKQRRDPRNFKTLLARAVREGRIRDEGFPWLEKERAEAREIAEALTQVGEGLELDPTPYTTTLLETLPSLRNYQAHPKDRAILDSNMALVMLRACADTINQLFPRVSTPE